MPNINETYNFGNALAASDLYRECLEVLKEMRAINFQEKSLTTPFVKEARVMIPSIWGWGGMNLDIAVEEQNGNVNMRLNGYIAQLGVTPLTKKMDIFLDKLALRLKAKYNYAFEFQRITRFLPKYKIHITKKDVIIFLAILAANFGAAAAGIFSSSGEGILTVVILLAGYYFGRKLFYK